MPTRPPQHRPAGWTPNPPSPRLRDEHARSYGTMQWRRTALAVIERDGGQCCYCGRLGADTAHHLVERRNGGTDAMHNLRAVHRRCHNRMHGRRGA